jgi:hypothetical protein
MCRAPRSTPCPALRRATAAPPAPIRTRLAPRSSPSRRRPAPGGPRSCFRASPRSIPARTPRSARCPAHPLVTVPSADPTATDRSAALPRRSLTVRAAASGEPQSRSRVRGSSTPSRMPLSPRYPVRQPVTAAPTVGTRPSRLTRHSTSSWTRRPACGERRSKYPGRISATPALTTSCIRCRAGHRGTVPRWAASASNGMASSKTLASNRMRRPGCGETRSCSRVPPPARTSPIPRATPCRVPRQGTAPSAAFMSSGQASRPSSARPRQTATGARRCAADTRRQRERRRQRHILPLRGQLRHGRAAASVPRGRD